MQSSEILVVGHICLDIIPELTGELEFEPGRLVEAGPATLSTGGAVSNTGISLAKLGVGTLLVGKIGPGILGKAVLEILESHAPGSSRSMLVVPGESTSYTVVLSLRGKDRMFIHSPGANATFGSSDVSDSLLEAHRWMHLGYPPLLARMYADGGHELEELFGRAKRAGLTTSLDLSLPDRNSASGQVDWKAILARVLPHVDLFVPSLGELLFMLDGESYDDGRLEGGEDRLMDRAMELGARHVALKLGERGLVLRVGDRGEEPGRGGPDWRSWRGQTIRQQCFRVDVAGTTGAGDATVAGLILGCLRGFDPSATCEAGAAAGACCCEKPDAISGMLTWESLKARIDAGWPLS